jgi:hypothetical protein
MKKLLLTLILITATAITYAQTLSFGIKDGLNLSTQSQTDGGYHIDSKNLAGLHAGAILDIDFKNFTIQPGIFFSGKGQRITSYLINENQQTSSVTTHYVLNYFEVPVNFLYEVPTDKFTTVYMGAGPYIGYGVSAYASAEGQSYSRPFSNDGFYKNPDYGVNLVFGVKLNGQLLIEANYEIGLTNVSSSQFTVLHNKVLGFSVGYYFR